MTCVCGHSDDEIGSEQFEQIWADRDALIVFIQKRTPSGLYYFDDKTIYACPICGTLKIKI